MGLRDRIQERREGDDGPGPSHYQMREKMFAIGDDYWIENGVGQRVIKVDGKALRVRDTLVLEDCILTTAEQPEFADGDDWQTEFALD